MRFSDQLLDDIRARLPVSQVVARKVALKKKGREFAGLSPFKTERTASFFVNDQKGFYHCFASGEHGDIFTFVMKTEGLSFPEAVERLAAEAGVPMPKPAARDEAREDQRTRLLALLEASAGFYEEQLKGPGGAAARRYLEARGLSRDAIQRFRLGYAPPSKSALRDRLTRDGYTVDELALSGMLISGDDIPVAYDRFRHRVMFPITNLREQVIAFGGRALDPDQPAKYLNSPETPLFHKGALLFNAARARAHAHERGRVIAVEGYLDVIAMSEAGLGETVAPLGTALTEDQVKLLWRLAPEPILCFDGDGAGRRAAFRAIDVILPLLRPGASVGFAFLPDGLDPDDLVRQQGPAAAEAILAKARPLADVLWEREWASGTWSTPERRAQLELQLRALTSRIGDAVVRQHYEREVRQRLWSAWRTEPARSGGPATMRQPNSAYRSGPQQSRPGTRTTNRGQGASAGPPWLQFRPQAGDSLRRSSLVNAETSIPPREALLLRAILNHPWLIDDDAEAIAGLVLSSQALSDLRDTVLAQQSLENSLDSPFLRTQLRNCGRGAIIDLVDRAITHRSDRFAEPDSDRAEVEIGWRHALALHDRQVRLKQSLQSAEREWHADGSEQALARICELQRELEIAGHVEP